MNGHRQPSQMSKSLVAGLVFILLLSTLPPVGIAGGPQAAQPALDLPLDLVGEPTLADLGPQALQQDGSVDARLPYNRIFHSTILDEDNDRLILFGGFNGRAYFNDVWALSLEHGSEAWTKISLEGIVPAPRGQHTAVYDSVNHRMIVFGGHSPYYNWNDVWALSLSPGSETWTQIVPTGSSPDARRWHTAVYDQLNNQMVIFGGVGRGGLFNDVWTLSLATGTETWSRMAVTGNVPAARAQHTAIYSDTTQGLMVVFGGATTGTLLNDTWTLNLTTLAWNQIAQAEPHPSARRGHTAVFNFVGGPVRMEVFGGQDSSGFLNDGWALEFTPGNIHWEQFTYYGAKPSARAWHSAVFSEMNPYQTTVLGGRGAEPTNGAQWALNMSGYTWSPITPTLPGWAQAVSYQTSAPTAGNAPQVTLEIEDALPATVVNVLRGSEVWFTTKLRSPSATYASNLTVTLSVDAAKFRIDYIGTRHNDWDTPLWGTRIDLGGGRYRITNVNLTKASGETDYSTQVIFRGYSLTTGNEGSTYPSVEAYGGNWPTRLNDNATARIYRDPQAWIITSRKLLFDKYTNSEVQRLLDEVFEQAQGSGYNGNPTMVVLYAERYESLLATWDNHSVGYSGGETIANAAANDLDEWLDTHWGVHPEYLVILGDDNIIPFYRQHDYVPDGVMGDQSEDDHPDCWGETNSVCDAAVSRGYFLTDNLYGDVPAGVYGPSDWEDGNLEIAVGRIVGATAADMQLFLENSARGPAQSASRAIIVSDGLDWNAPNDTHDAWNAIVTSLGYEANESLTDNNAATRSQVINEMQLGFGIMAAANHGEVYLWEPPTSSEIIPSGYIVSYDLPTYDTAGRMATNRPFFYFNACRIGWSYTDGWGAGAQGAFDDTLVYALVHRGASGIVASAGLSYGCFDPNILCAGEVLANKFWDEAKAYPDRSDPLGWSLMRAKVNHPVNNDITEKKTVQSFAYFGVPWMRLPGHGSASASAAEADASVSAWSVPTLLHAPGNAPSAIQATYVVTAHINASSYTTQTSGGFNLIDVMGMTQRAQDGQVVLPRATLDLILPLSATIVSRVFTPTLPVTLTNMNIPTIQTGVPIPGGSRGGYTDTLNATYPATVSLSIHNMGSYQIARFAVIPVGYNATLDQARLYQSIDVQVQYDTPRTVALTYFTTPQLYYLPGEAITVTASISNVGSLAETVTPTLRIVDAQGNFTGTIGAAFAVPAGGTYDLSTSWTGTLDGDAYMVYLFLEQDGEVVAGAGREVFVTEGALTGLAAPTILMPGQTGTFTVTFQNYTAVTTTVLASLSIYDTQGALLAFLESKSANVAGGSFGTLSFVWTADRPGPFVASAVVMAGGQEYGPVSRAVGGPFRIFLPVVLKN